MRARRLQLAVSLAALAGGCQDTAPPARLQLQQSFDLPKPLREVSGIAWDGVRLLGIQDEVGKLFAIDARGAVAEAERFGPKADYEDLALAPGRVFVLRSDGVLLEFAPERPEELLAEVPLAAGDERSEFESLAYDAARHRLLFARKVGPRGETPRDERRLVHAFDLQTRTVLPQPAVMFSLTAVEARARELGVPLPERRGKGPARSDLQLRISALAVQPGTDTLWVLSAADRVLVAVTLAGVVEHVHAFDGAELHQPEGMCFAAPDRLWIASEAGEAPARLCRFGIGPPR